MDKATAELVEECKKISQYCSLRSLECQKTAAARNGFARRILLQYPAVIAALLPLAGAAISLVAPLAGLRDLAHLSAFCGPAVCATFSLLTAVLCICGFDRDFSGQQNLAAVLQGLSFRADALAKTANRLPADNFAAMVRSLKSEFQGVLDAAGMPAQFQAVTGK